MALEQCTGMKSPSLVAFHCLFWKIWFSPDSRERGHPVVQWSLLKDKGLPIDSAGWPSDWFEEASTHHHENRKALPEKQ